MALNLDARQRAMLQDMGITVWAPRAHPAPAAPVTAVAAVAAVADVTAPAPATTAPRAVPTPVRPATVAAESTTAPVGTAHTVAPAAPTLPAPPVTPSAPHAPAAPAVAARPPAVPAQAAATWWAAPLVHAYADLPHDETDDAGWLVLLECSDPLDPFAGETGALLNNMLRALRLHRHPRVRIAPLTRQAPADDAASAWQPLAPAVHAALTTHSPARVLLMGLHAARAVLGRSEALGPLRAVVHPLHDIPTVVTYDPAYLLRAAHAKPGAWADLCRAHALQPPSAPAATH